MIHPKKVPNLIYSDLQGNIFDEPSIETGGRSASNFLPLKPEDFILMPEGSELHHLPNRRPVGFLRKNKQKLTYPEGQAVAAFVAPAHTQYYLCAYEKEEYAPILPLFAYSAVGWLDGNFYVAATRIDPDNRQDCETFDQALVEQNAHDWMKKYPDNRLIQHLGSNCALTYFCPAARNFFLKRFEAPLPTSPSCNSRCVGCISLQEDKSGICSPQDRILFLPTPEEIAQVALMHIAIAPRAVVSFGQGCEGEPLMVFPVLEEAIRLIRRKTKEGIINLNTNASKPELVEKLFEAGLDSIRVSLNSVREEAYNRYYRPLDYTFAQVRQSSKIAAKFGKWASLNYFVFPGVTDSLEEYNALVQFIRATGINMIQWRNFNIDPDWYYQQVGGTGEDESLSMPVLLQKIREEFPGLYFGYFNPPLSVIQQNYPGFKVFVS
jgi:pyruvate-formate lyase-activating enzyme